MPRFRSRHDPYWDLEGRNVRRARTTRRIVGTLLILLSCAILGLILMRLPLVDARAVLFGPTRPLVFVSLGADLLACCLVLLRALRLPLAS